MAQRNDGIVTFSVDGETYRLVGDMNALMDFEREFGVNAFTLLNGGENGAVELSATHSVGLFWAMLQEHHPDMTLRAAGKLLPYGMGQMQQALALAFPEPEASPAGGEAEKPKARPPRR